MAYSEPERDVDLVVAPSDDLRITFLIDYKNPALGTQYTTLVNLEEEFVNEFAAARTFCFLSEVEMLKNNGLIKGGGIDNAVVIYDSDLGQIEVDRIRKVLDLKDKCFVGETGIINDVPLRFYNEPVRHKTLDSFKRDAARQLQRLARGQRQGKERVAPYLPCHHRESVLVLPV